MKHGSHRWIQVTVTIVSVGLAWWLVHRAGTWTSGSLSFAQFLCFALCALAIDRILAAAVDMAIIAFEPSERQAHPHDPR